MATPSQVGDAIADTLKGIAQAAVVSAIIAAVPFLGFPFFRTLLNGLIGFILGKMESKIEVVAFLLYSKAVTEHEVTVFNQAAKDKLEAEAKGDQNAINEATQKLLDAARALGKLNNVH